MKSVENSEVKPQEEKERDLTPKQRLFIKEYLIDLNATQAAIRAGYSEESAKVIAAENLSKPYLANAIEEELKKREEKVEVSAEWVLSELKKLAKVCNRTYINENGEEVAINPAGANRALELIGKHLGMYRDVIENKGQGFQLVIHEPEEKSPINNEIEVANNKADTLPITTDTKTETEQKTENKQVLKKE